MKDNQTGKLIAQLKFRSLSEKDILAVKVKIMLLDTAEKPLDTEVTYQYLDLCAARDEDFGSKTPVFLPDSAARSYAAAVSKVIFADKTFWQSAGQPWETLPVPEPLEGALKDAETLKQYHLQYGADCRYKPLRQKDLWYCTCGGLSWQEEPTCHCCGRKFTEWNAAFIQELTAKRDERLAEEKKACEEQLAAKNKNIKKAKKIAIVTVSLICAIASIAVLLKVVIIPNSKYNKAVALRDNGQYDEAIAAFEAMEDYKNSAEQILECRYRSGLALMDAKRYEEAIVTFEEVDGYKNSIEEIAICKYDAATALMNMGETAQAAMRFASIDYKDSTELSAELWNEIAVRDTVTAGGTFLPRFSHTIGLKTNGVLIAVGGNGYGECDFSDWTDIVAVASGAYHTVGLKANGTVVAVGSNEHEQCNVSGWSDVVAIAAGTWHTIGLKADGTVVAAGDCILKQCDVSDRTDIVAISAGGYYTVGLRADGTVVAVGDNKYGQCNVSNWKDIVSISANQQTVGLKTDGTVVAVGKNSYGQCDVYDWTDIVAVSAGFYHTVGLKSNGTVVVAGENNYGQSNVSDWTDIRLPK